MATGVVVLTEKVGVKKCTTCPDGGRLSEVGVDWPLLHSSVPADRPTGAIICNSCGLFLVWVA